LGKNDVIEPGDIVKCTICNQDKVVSIDDSWHCDGLYMMCDSCIGLMTRDIVVSYSLMDIIEWCMDYCENEVITDDELVGLMVNRNGIVDKLIAKFRESVRETVDIESSLMSVIRSERAKKRNRAEAPLT
jgi:hypothetical protein